MLTWRTRRKIYEELNKEVSDWPKRLETQLHVMIIELGIRRNEDILIIVCLAVGMAGPLARCAEYIGHDGVGVS